MSLTKRHTRDYTWLTALSMLAIYVFLAQKIYQSPLPKRHLTAESIVLPATIQVLMYGGDRFLGANIESARAAGANNTFNLNKSDYRIRARQLVSQLNPCHEDNYWIGNVTLTWGGAVDDGLALLERAMQCRYWDEWPAFFYGFNQHVLRNNNNEMRRGLELAAQRSKLNASVFKKFSIMITAGEFDNARAARDMIKRERDKTHDDVLRKMLDDRIARFTGLIQLRDAQAAYEKRYERPLTNAKQLIETGIITEFPTDPLGLGYTYNNQTFQLREIPIR